MSNSHNVNKLVFLTLPFELMEKLNKEPNKSELLRELLTKHYTNSKLSNLSSEQAIKLKEMVIQRDQLIKEIEDVVANA